MTINSIDLLKSYPEDRPRTPEEIDLLIVTNALFVAVSRKVPNLTIEEFKEASRAPIDLGIHRVSAADRRGTPENEAEAEAVYVDMIANYVHAQREGDDEAAVEAAIRASDARGVLWGVRDRINDLIFPWADPALGDDVDSDVHLF